MLREFRIFSGYLFGFFPGHLYGLQGHLIVGPTYGAMPCMGIGPIWVAYEAIGQLPICIVMVL